MRTAGRLRAAAAAVAVLATTAVTSVMTQLPAGAAPATPAPAAAAPGTPAPSHAAPTAHPVRSVCDRPSSPRRARCLSVQRTDVVGAKGRLAPNAVPAGYGPADLQDAYRLPATAGAGATVAIVDAFDNPNAEADLAVYRAQYGLAPCTTDNGCFRKVDQRGGTTYPVPDPGWAGEISLDLDMVSAACPNCHLLLVEADDNSVEALGESVNTAVRLGAKYVSNSYGADEFAGQTQADEQYYNHPGVVVTVSSGDNGFADGPQFPASSGYVTAVGGTSLVRSNDARGWSESAWSRAGSGCSGIEGKPAFQSDPDCAHRTIADVAAVADPNTGVAVYDTYQMPGWSVFGGTSASAPIVAAAYALAGQPAAGDYPNAYPYQTPAALNDVTEGTNGSCGTYLCSGRPGYDGPTGLGTPSGVLAFRAPGAHGTVSGTVTNAADQRPVEGARVAAGDAAAVTDAQGHYSMVLPVGTYDMTASAFGYADADAPGVSVTEDNTVTRDFALTVRASVTVGGTVADGSGHGWPLYAKVAAQGTPVSTYTDPRTGRYELTLPADGSYTLHVTPQYTGYQSVDEQVTTGSGSVTRDVAVPVDATTCTAPGYAFGVTGAASSFDGPDFPAGWTVRDNTGGGAWTLTDLGHRGNLTGGTGGFAVIDSDALGAGKTQDTELLTPVVDLTGVPAPVLTFNTDYRGLGGQSADVDVSLDSGTTWANVWHHGADGEVGIAEHLDLPQAAGRAGVQLRFHYRGSFSWWWQVDDVVFGVRHCDPVPGGLLVGQVLDGNTGDALRGATVTSDERPAETATTATTPADPALADGFYAMFSSLAGTHRFTAARAAYRPTTLPVDVAADRVTAVDFTLGAGHLVLGPARVDATAQFGARTTARVTFTNDGSLPVDVRLGESDGGAIVLAALAAQHGAPPQRVAATTSPHRFSTRTATAAPAVTAPSAPPWTSVANHPWEVMDGAVVTADDGRVYTFGGVDGAGHSLTAATAYDPSTQAWTQLGSMGVERDAPVAAFLDGRIFVVGGWAVNGVPVTALEILNPNTGTWSTGASVPTAYAGAAVAVLDGRMYVVGGCDATVCGHRDVWVYDPGADAWSRAADYPQPTSWASCGAIGSALYCAGGTTDDAATSSAYVYRPGVDAWAPIADLPVDLWGSGYTAANGLLLVSGGAARQGSVITNEGYAYDPAADAWSPLPNSNDAVYRGGASCGMYKVGGSLGGFTPTPHAELLPGYGQCGAASDVAWLATDTARFSVAPGAAVTVTLTLDAGVAAVTQPGTYLARLTADNDSPYGAAVPVSFTVTPPKSWGKVAGTVTGVRCDGSVVPLQGATVEIDSTQSGYALRTDVNGRYALWLDKRNSPLTVVVARDGWRPQTRQVRIKAGATVTADFALVPTASCG